MGKSLERMGRYEAATEKFQKVVELEPRNTAAYLWWGYTLEWWGKKDEAAKEYETVLQLKPEETYFTDYAEKGLLRVHPSDMKS
jgi:Flp pilus assembly protein TadD